MINENMFFKYTYNKMNYFFVKSLHKQFKELKIFSIIS